MPSSETCLVSWLSSSPVAFPRQDALSVFPLHCGLQWLVVQRGYDESLCLSSHLQTLSVVVCVCALLCCCALSSGCGVFTGAAGRVGVCAAPSEPQPAPAACEGPAIQNHDGHPQRGATPDDKPSHMTTGSRNNHHNNCLSVWVPVCVLRSRRRCSRRFS